MYLVILKGDTKEVDMIYKDAPTSLHNKGYIIESLEEEGQFMRIDEKLYFIKEID